VGLVFWFFFEAIPDRRLAAIAFALFAGLEYVLFDLLPGNYMLDTLNLFMCIHPKELLTSYEVLSPFGLTLGRIESFLVLCAAVTLVGVTLLLVLNRKRKPSAGIGWVTRLTDFWRRHTAAIGFHGKLFFHESPHPTECGSLDIYGILRALYENGFDGYIRPDHGRNIWGESGKPGYGLYDRALGAVYLSGIWEALEKTIGR
jgi:hypothetical protein